MVIATSVTNNANPATNTSSLSDGSHCSSSPWFSLFFYQINKSIQCPRNQSGCIISIAMWACSVVHRPLANTWITSQNAVAALCLHMSLQIVQVRFEVTCSLNVANSLLCWSPILLISRKSSETRATFSSIASSLSLISSGKCSLLSVRLRFWE